MNLCSLLPVFNIFIHPICFQPQFRCPNANITFWLYIRANRYKPHQLLVNDPRSITSAPFVKNATIKILIHGFLGNKDATPNSELRPEYMKCCNYNIISVDYEFLAKMPCYAQAAYNTKLVGMCTAQLVDVLVNNYGFDLCLMHPIGFSLGGQAVGFLGNYVRSGRFERITGLDVALPLFTTADINSKLDPTDAKFVDVLHTNALMCGKFRRCGTVDFMANNGMSQPGCKHHTFKDLISYIKGITICSHSRAAEYYAESINSKVGFYGLKCDTWIGYMTGLCKLFHKHEPRKLFGEHVRHNSEGTYYFSTKSQPPFAIGTRTLRTLEDNIDDLQTSEESEDLFIQNPVFEQEYSVQTEEMVITSK